jgi:hypothetical protein
LSVSDLIKMFAKQRVVDCFKPMMACHRYAAGASGNVATEDVLYMLHGMGVYTGALIRPPAMGLKGRLKSFQVILVATDSSLCYRYISAPPRAN